MAENSEKSQIVHASCVAIGPSAVLLVGPSGSGKSSLALQLMAMGAILIADDRTTLSCTQFGISATCPSEIKNMIEARGVGLLAAESQSQSYIRLVVDLGAEETERLPPEREVTLLGQRHALLHTPVHGHFPAAILQYMKGGRIA